MKKKKAAGVLGEMLENMNQKSLRRTRNRMLLAAKIYDALVYHKISQKRFAEMMGKSESEISDWLSGDRNFTVDTLSDISDVLGIQLLDVSLDIKHIIPSTILSRKIRKNSRRQELEKSVSWNKCNIISIMCKEKQLCDNFG